MQIAEIRDLDGPNLFLPQPAIKLEIDTGGPEPQVAESMATAFVVGDSLPAVSLVPVSTERLMSLLTEVIHVLHDRAGVARPRVMSRTMEIPNHVVVAFEWSHRSFAKGLAKVAYDFVAGTIDNLDEQIQTLRDRATTDLGSDDLPDMMTDARRTVPVVGITGTNGKTTTTRLLSSILMHSGHRVGWTSSGGVLIQGKEVLKGDYTGPAGAARVFEAPDLDYAILETARGGILLRGLGYESNDVSVVTNISADHLGLQGVETVDELARVKRVVVVATRPEGAVVLNADDERVLAMRNGIEPRVILFSRQPDNPAVISHVQDRGWGLWVDNGEVVFGHDGITDVLTVVNDIPISLGGRASHMLENALAATGAALALGLELDEVRAGLAAFHNHTNQNRGRLNAFEIGGVTVIVDFAHNPAGLAHLLKLGRAFAEGESRLISIIGAAGDRQDESLREIGEIAGEASDVVIVKDTERYLRGRDPGEIPRIVLEGLDEDASVEVHETGGEFEAFEFALSIAKPGDAVAIMCLEDVDQIIDYLEENGKVLG